MTDELATIASVPTGLHIGGEWRAAQRQMPVHDPATGDVLTDVPDAAPADGLDALAAATEVQAGWAAHPPRERAEILRRAFDMLVAESERFALLITLEMGKPLAESRAEVGYGAEFLRWFSEEANRIHGDYRVAPAGTSRLLTMRQPVGPALLITPWNFPLAMATRKVAAAIAAGCIMVLKPAQQTPLTALAFTELLVRAGLPAGVLNTVTTSDPGSVVEPLVRDPRARKLSFTGSTRIGRQLIEQSAQGVLRVSMELGGNAPFLVFPDADLDAAVAGAMVAKMRNMGEACTAANRFHVHESVADEFVDRLRHAMSGLVLGRGTDPRTTVGPLISQTARDGVDQLVQDAVNRGARVTLGGSSAAGPGWFYEPTVIRDVPSEAVLVAGEIFGPVAPVLTFADEDEAIRAANDTEFGLVSYLYTQDLGRALRVGEALEAGMVALNTGLVSNPAAPFGGVKASGLGREGGREGIEEYLEVKYLAIGGI